MIMKTKYVKNTGQMVRRGQIGKLPGGQRRHIARGVGKGVKLPGVGKGGHCPFFPIALVRPCMYLISFVLLSSKVTVHHFRKIGGSLDGH